LRSPLIGEEHNHKLHKLQSLSFSQLFCSVVEFIEAAFNYEGLSTSFLSLLLKSKEMSMFSPHFIHINSTLNGFAKLI